MRLILPGGEPAGRHADEICCRLVVKGHMPGREAVSTKK
jgi:hypothetical protein